MTATAGKRRAFVLTLGAVMLAALAVLRRPAADLLVALAAWVDGLGWVAPFAFSLIFAAAVPLFVPAGPFLLAAGVLFGPLVGLLFACLGNAVGGAVSFGLGRHLLRRWIEGKLGGSTGFAAVQEALRREGLRAALLIRFSPILPAWLINYALGVSPLSWRHYLLSSVAILPSAVVYTLAGAGVGELAALERGGRPAPTAGHWALLGTGIAATLVATVLLGRRAKRIFEALDDG